MELDPRTTAVVAVHMINDVVTHEGAFGQFFGEGVERGQIIRQVGRLLDAARTAGATPVYTRVVFKPGHPDLVVNCPLLGVVAQTGAVEDGKPGAEIVPELTPQPGEHVVDHQRLTGFHGTELDVLLRGKGIKTVVLAGVATNVSVEGTAREAVNLGYRTIVVSDACSAASDEAHQATLDTFGLLGEVVTVNEVEAALERAAVPA
ncbi:nicotinamidase-related amidase [Actinomycetospora succinea]|uniref:Nicotinamidase-related amidase n=1 Tax=Actinomycetospora succinea TaxID=663603 RepID=A0A4R6VHY2_9PSEU|nr:cysteine hydrolase [Actinomycetospora succinea]TDQ60946.1 nicotinamidase-related amidase [Actinomycetospora succinea]